MLPELIDNNLRWWISGAIIVLGLFVYGLKDFRKLVLGGGFKRAWAISSVCFAESIRRRVLWIAPLAILGVLGVSQFIRGGEQDIVRQTIKYSLFASGMVVTITGIILACTNLPKEIETRVIYTIVTKPTTRLEIVVGKVLGFAKVSLTILLIMGVFTYIFAHFRAWSLQREIQGRLEAGTIEQLSLPTYKYWAENGLLSSRTFATPADLQIMAKEPDDTNRRWFYGSGDADIVVPFYIPAEGLIPEGVPNAAPGDGGLIVQLRVGYARSKFIGAPEGVTVDTSQPLTTSKMIVDFYDQDMNPLLDAAMVNNAQPVTLEDPTGTKPVYIQLKPEAVKNLLRSPLFYIGLSGGVYACEYSVDISDDPNLQRAPIVLYVPGNPPDRSRMIGPLPADIHGPYRPAPPNFRGRGGMYGQLLRGGRPDKSPVAIYKFRDAAPRISADTVPFEFRARIELSNTDGDEESDIAQFEMIAIDQTTGKQSQPIAISPENNRTSYFSVPAEFVKGGNFDIRIRSLGSGHFATLDLKSLEIVTSDDSFDGNLLRSLGILWMLSILVVIISICCSTFLSWPIAIVLTLLLLLGHWGIMQVSDSLAPGIGNLVAQDLFGAREASEARVVSAYVEAMARMLNQLANVLPDIGKFAAVEDIEQGITISARTFLAPFEVLAAFGLPMLVASYVFLRNKEVAP